MQKYLNFVKKMHIQYQLNMLQKYWSKKKFINPNKSVDFIWD